MISHTLLAKKNLSHSTDMDYALLRQQGIKQIEQLGGTLWTDYNTHDPGITILEQLCYAITDLGYRINHQIPDILAENNDDPYESLFTAEEILPSNPVSLLDLRKLIIDIKGVKNVWIEKFDITEAEPGAIETQLYFQKEQGQLYLSDNGIERPEKVKLQGLYQILVEPDQFRQESLKQQIAEQLNAYRNLCEDYTSITLLKKQDIQIDAKIEIDAVEDAEQVLSNIHAQIADYFSPPLKIYSLNELLAQGKTIDEIYQGPALQHGFIDSSELLHLTRRTELRTSDLVRTIMDIPGVRAVQNFKFVLSRDSRQVPIKIEKWLLKLDKSSTPQFDSRNSQVILVKDQLELQIPSPDKTIKPDVPINSEYNTLTVPASKARDINAYISIQHQLPDLYGVNGNGLSTTVSPQRKAQAKQLKAYLLFFDQLLANYFSQLAHTKELFSFADNKQQTYFSQILDDAELGLDETQKNNLGLWLNDKATRTTNISILSVPASEQNSKNTRKNRFLNHLLARFAEQFSDYSLALYNLGTQEPDKLLHDKQSFLQNYPEHSRSRGTAFNYLKPIGPENQSGLEQRIRYKLGIIDSEEQFYIVEHILLRPIQDDSTQQAPLLSETQRKDPYSLQLSLVFPDWPERFQSLRFRQFIEQTVRNETPAHLTAYIRWLDKNTMHTFETAHKNENWLKKRRAQWSNQVPTESESSS